MHVVCHATTDLKFGSCTVLSSSSPEVEASKPVKVKVESQSTDTISVIEVPASIGLVDCACTVKILMIFYHNNIMHAPLELCSYWGC